MEEMMPRPYSDGFVLGLDKADDSKIGVQLAKVCLKSNLPIKYVADGLDVSRMTLHTWFRGGILRQHNKEKVEKFIELAEQGKTREKMWLDNPDWFFPDGAHPNKQAHEKLYSHLKKENVI